MTTAASLASNFIIDAVKGKIPVRIINYVSHGFNQRIYSPHSDAAPWIVDAFQYPVHVTPSQISVVSTSVEDNATTNTGARQVMIEGTNFDNSEFITETVTLNGITPVLTSQVFKSVNSFTRILKGPSGPKGTVEGKISNTLVFRLTRAYRTAAIGTLVMPTNYIGFIFNITVSSTGWTDFLVEVDEDATGSPFEDSAPFVTLERLTVFSAPVSIEYGDAPLIINPGAYFRIIARPQNIFLTYSTSCRIAIIRKDLL